MTKTAWEMPLKFSSWNLWRLDDTAYLAFAHDQSWSLVVDPAFGLNGHQKKLVADHCDRATRRIAWVSHPHDDHFHGAPAWRELGYEVVFHQESAQLIHGVSGMSGRELSVFLFGTSKIGMGGRMMLRPLQSAIKHLTIDHEAQDGPMIGGLPFEVRSFAGHSPSDSMLINPECVFSGDIAFMEDGEFVPANCELPKSNRKLYLDNELIAFIDLAGQQPDALFCPGHHEMSYGRGFLLALDRFVKRVTPDDT